jgi:alcohol dehydrogenase class IV
MSRPTSQSAPVVVQRADVDRVFYGAGCVLDDVSDRIRGLAGVKQPRIAVVCTERLVKDEWLCRLSNELDTVMLSAAPHAPWSWLHDAAADLEPFRPDVILAYGSGSAIDAAKLLREQLSRPAPTADVLAQRVRVAPDANQLRPRLIAVPTTLSGAAFTSSAGTMAPGPSQTARKLVVKAPWLAADVALLDPLLCATVASDVWASTGFKAVEHAVESIYSPSANVVSTALCVQGLTLLGRSLRAERTHSAEDALDCLVASWLVLMGRRNITFGPSHAVGHQLGGALGIAHGLTAAAVLPSVMRFVEADVPEEQQVSAAAVRTAGQPSGTPPWAVMKAWAEKLGLPTSVRELGVPHQLIDVLAPAVAEDIRRESGTVWLDRIDERGGVDALLGAVW